MLKDKVKFTAMMEGLSLKLYRCPAGRLTIGYGHNIEDNGISSSIAEKLLEEDMSEAERYLKNYCPYVSKFHSAWQDICRDMIFNLGPKRFASMTRFNQAIKEFDVDKALAEMIDSAWFGQVGRRSKLLWISGYRLMPTWEVYERFGKIYNKAFYRYFIDWYLACEQKYPSVIQATRIKKVYKEALEYESKNK